MELANFVYDISCAIILFLVFLNGRKNEYDFTQKVFNFFVVSVQFFLVLDGFAWLCQINYTSLSCTVETILMSFVFIFQGFQGVFWVLYEECYLNNRVKISIPFKVIFIVQFFVSCGFVIVNIFTGCLFYITVETGYVRGPYYVFNYALYGVYFISAIIIGLRIIIRNKDKELQKAALVNLVGVFFVLICFVIQCFWLGVNLVSPAISLSILMIYLSVQQKKIENNKIRHIKNLEAITFGNFDILFQNQSIKFKRTKSKELLAYLIDRKGASVTMDELYSILWEKDFVDDSTKSLLRNIISDIKQTLNGLNLDGFFVKDFNSCRINPDMISCDYFDFLKSKDLKGYTGEYMNQYSWAETTAGYLDSLVNKK